MYGFCSDSKILTFSKYEYHGMTAEKVTESTRYYTDMASVVVVTEFSC